ncbi:hypothetical protein RND71_020204 [Anisodus tanguticus]|uniref:Uncharacterized protein n=1 Tax=Anisodus tanguticus TaxID=243964 RepID=A0AAE1VA50_9SOLA|nr:hypothetical protein RND71_020204 [Anisodus tanguticus]
MASRDQAPGAMAQCLQENQMMQSPAWVEYIISDRIFETLPAEEQKLWHSHEYERWSKSQNLIILLELMASFGAPGKFFKSNFLHDIENVILGGSGDMLPLGAPALMMSPQAVNLGMVAPELVKKRDERYGISSKDLEITRVDIAGPETTMNPYANYWMQTGKGFAIDVELTDMKKTATFP